MCLSFEDTVFCRNVLVAIPIEVLVCVSRFPVIKVRRVLSGPGETKMSKNGMAPLLLGTSVMNFM